LGFFAQALNALANFCARVRDPGSRVAESLDPPLHPSISLIHATWSAVSREGRRTRPTSAVMAVMT